LRALLLVMTIVAIWLGFTTKRIRDRHRAIEAILSYGGGVHFKDLTNASARGVPFEERHEPPGRPAWLRRLLGKHGKFINCDIQFVFFHTSRIPSDDAPFDISVLESLTELKELQLGVLLDKSPLERLPKLPNLVSLNIGRMRLSEDELACLARLPKLTKLVVRNSQLTAKCYRNIASRRNLVELVLQECALTADGLDQLATLPTLTSLSLWGSTLGDEAIPHLSQLRGLKELLVVHSQLSRQGVQKLQAALPECRILSENDIVDALAPLGR
jgi:hypothetical protein